MAKTDVPLMMVEQGVKVIGIDAYTLERPFANMIADYRRTGDGRFIWPAHFAGIEREYCQIEKLNNLDQLPRPHGFHVSCLPVKIQGASVGCCPSSESWPTRWPLNQQATESTGLPA